MPCTIFLLFLVNVFSRWTFLIVPFFLQRVLTLNCCILFLSGGISLLLELFRCKSNSLLYLFVCTLWTFSRIFQVNFWPPPVGWFAFWFLLFRLLRYCLYLRGKLSAWLTNTRQKGGLNLKSRRRRFSNAQLLSKCLLSCPRSKTILVFILSLNSCLYMTVSLCSTKHQWISRKGSQVEILVMLRHRNYLKISANCASFFLP